MCSLSSLIHMRLLPVFPRYFPVHLPPFLLPVRYVLISLPMWGHLPDRLCLLLLYLLPDRRMFLLSLHGLPDLPVRLPVPQLWMSGYLTDLLNLLCCLYLYYLYSLFPLHRLVRKRSHTFHFPSKPGSCLSVSLADSVSYPLFHFHRHSLLSCFRSRFLNLLLLRVLDRSLLMFHCLFQNGHPGRKR